MFRWIAVLAAVVLVVGVAYGQSAPQPQPTLPLGQGQTMGGHMNAPMMGGDADMGQGMMQMMQMMQMMHTMESGMMGPGMHDADMMGQGMCRGQMVMMRAAGMDGAPASHLEARLAFAKAELAITAAQDDAWQAYASALRSQAQQAGMPAMHRAMADNAAFPARFDARITTLEGRLAGMKAIREAAVALYDKLDDGQKKKADMLLPMSLCL